MATASSSKTHLPFVASFPPRQAQVPPVLRGKEGGVGGRRGRIGANFSKIWRNRMKSTETARNQRKETTSHEIKRMKARTSENCRNRSKLSETLRNLAKPTENERNQSFSSVFGCFRSISLVPACYQTSSPFSRVFRQCFVPFRFRFRTMLASFRRFSHVFAGCRPTCVLSSGCCVAGGSVAGCW